MRMKVMRECWRRFVSSDRVCLLETTAWEIAAWLEFEGWPVDGGLSCGDVHSPWHVESIHDSDCHAFRNRSVPPAAPVSSSTAKKRRGRRRATRGRNERLPLEVISGPPASSNLRDTRGIRHPASTLNEVSGCAN
jgi:hypothetical protein